jgi:hypothetical protein
MKSALFVALCALSVVAADVAPPVAAAAANPLESTESSPPTAANPLATMETLPTGDKYEWCRRWCYWRHGRHICHWHCWK